MKKDPYAPLRAQMNEPPTAWRSLEHKEGHPSVAEALEVEFPSGITQPDGFNRRDALKLAGASLALGALSGCDKLPVRRPEEEILPFVRMPEKVIPGVRLEYATVMARSEGAVGLVVESHEGRPTKIEGNPKHPSSLGASDTWAQAEVLRLYDPERARTPLHAGQPSTWEKWAEFSKDRLGRLATAKGQGLALLLSEESSPTFDRLLEATLARLPEAKVYRWDPTGPDASLVGAELAFGPGARPHWTLDKVKVVYAVDSDFLLSGPEHLKLARQWGQSRAVKEASDGAAMLRLYASEGAWTMSGTNADHRLRLSSGQQIDVLKALARELSSKHGVDLGELAAAVQGAALPAEAQKFVAALAKDLAAHRGAVAIIAGERQPPAVHALGYALTAALGSLGTALTVTVGAATPRTSLLDSLTALTRSLQAGEVDTLVVFDCNPLYTAPGALRFAEAMAKAKTVVHLGVLAEETGKQAEWHLPAAHFLEAWGDARGWDGTASLVQPLILPLFGGLPPISLLAQLAGEADVTDKKLVEATWRGPGAPLADLKAWRRALHDGLIPSTAWPKAEVAAKRPAVAAAVAALKGVTPSLDALELVARQGHLLDGRLTNVAWLMELPDSMSKLCWDNAILVAPTLAKELGLTSAVKKNKYSSDLLELTVGDRKLVAPTFVLPGLAPYTMVINMGYGRASGDVAKGVGVDVGPLLTGPTVVQGLKARRTGATTELCSTQDHFSVPGNQLKELTFAEMVGEPKGARERGLGLGNRPLFRSLDQRQLGQTEKLVHAADPPELQRVDEPRSTHPMKLKQPVDEVVYEGQQWGMVIDLGACTGCNICTVACVAENNIATVGREQVLLGRELHWIRIDRYFMGDVEQPLAVHQPVTCMHCESAPCEPVCPVGATVHDEEGLNDMAYNRCIGTRYCGNNCPYKVRRFNYLDFTHTGNVSVDPVAAARMKTLKLQRNPDVTVRYRGVMEKCTYCTQRVEEAKISAKRAGHDRKALPDGAVTPACAQACPTQAITFGNINDPAAKVAQLKGLDRNYEMLAELNIRPRTSYLARVRNENEELV